MVRNGQERNGTRLVALLYAHSGFFRLYGDEQCKLVRAVPIGHPFLLFDIAKSKSYRTLVRQLEAAVIHDEANAFAMGRPIFHTGADDSYAAAFQFYAIAPSEHWRAEALSPADDLFKTYFPTIGA